MNKIGFAWVPAMKQAKNVFLGSGTEVTQLRVVHGRGRQGYAHGYPWPAKRVCQYGEELW
jgi:hypothetical protein